MSTVDRRILESTESSRGVNGGTPTEVRLVVASLVLAGLILVVCLAARQATGARVDSLPIFYRLVTEDWALAFASVVMIMVSTFACRIIPAKTVSSAASRLGDRAVFVGIGATILGAVGTIGIYLNHPFSMDEYAAVFQAKVFAAGRLTALMPLEVMPHAFGPGFIGQFFTASPATGEIVANYWPGFALLAAPFAWLDLIWLVNPILAGLVVLVIAHVARTIYGSSEAAGWAVAFTVSSPVFLINAMSFYSMTAHLLFNLVFAALLLRSDRYRALAAGLVGGFALVLHNPIPHILFAAPWVVYLLFGADRRPLLKWLVLGYLPVCLIGGLGWAVLWQKIGLPGLGAGTVQTPGRVGLIFGLPGAELTVARVLELGKSIVWAAPGLFVLALIGLRSGWKRHELRLFTLSWVATFAGYLFVTFDQGHGWGARYLHSAWMALPLLAPAALQRLVSGGRTQPRSLAATLATSGLLVCTPVAAFQVNSIMQQQLAQLPPQERGAREIIFVDPAVGYYTEDLIQNDPFLRTFPIILASRGASADSALIDRAFPGAARKWSGRAGSVWQE
jgi:hypothetical protein